MSLTSPFRSLPALRSASSLPPPSVRPFSQSGLPRLPTSGKNPKISGRVGLRDTYCHIFPQLKGIGSFSLIASLIIFVMGITMLKLDRAKTKWRVKLQHAFEGQREIHPFPLRIRLDGFVDVDSSARRGKWILFILPFITVLREGLEAVVFVGGVSLGQPAASIPIAAIVGIVCGLICGFVIYTFASRSGKYSRPFRCNALQSA